VINDIFNSYFSLNNGGMKAEYMKEIHWPAASHCQS